MKLRLLSAFALIFMMILSGCSQKDDTLEPLQGNDRETQETDGKGGDNDVDVTSNGDKQEDESTNDSLGIESELEEESEIGDNDDSHSEEADKGKESDSEEVIQEQYAVLDLSEPEDVDNYTSSLVFIRQEEDLWRVVDRMGRVFRVSSSYDGVKPGIVNNGATIKVEEGNPSVSLVRDYTDYDNAYILETDPEELAMNFSKALLEDQKATSSSSRIDDYTLKSADIVENIGKGIVKVRMIFDVDVDSSNNDSPWANGRTQDIKYDYTLYGYETTWILPVKEPLYYAVTANLSSENNQSETTSDIDLDNENTDESNEGGSEVDTGSESDTDEEAQVVIATDLKVDVGEINGTTVFYEKVLLPQSEELSGTNIYEHNVNLKIRKDNIVTSVVKGEKNGTYEWLVGYDNKAYLFNQIHIPGSEVIYSGISMVNVDDASYRTIYNGAVAKGILLDDSYYVFGNDNLFEINLANSSFRIAAVLPIHLDFTLDSLRVIEMKDQEMKVEITRSETVENYVINVSNGEMEQIQP